jgi:hypothetical protein
VRKRCRPDLRGEAGGSATRTPAIGHLEKLAAQQAPQAGVAARQSGLTWDAIGKALGSTRKAAFQRFARYFPQ